VSWFVRNLAEMRWADRGPRGFEAELVPDEDAQVGVNLFVLEPGQPMSMYHWEADQEGFLVLRGEAVLIVEEQELPLRQWDYVHCPPRVAHTIVGAGSGPCAILALGARIDSVGPGWGAYPRSEVASRYDASVEQETTDPALAYARFPARRPAEFRPDWLR